MIGYNFNHMLYNFKNVDQTFETIGKRKNSKRAALINNQVEYQNVFNTLLNLTLDRFKYKAPDTFDVRLFESSLIWMGFAAGERDNAGNIWSWHATPGGTITRYGYSDTAFLSAMNGENREVKLYWKFMDNTGATAVLCMNDKYGYPMIYQIMRGAERIADAKRALDVAAENSKRPFIFTGTEEQTKAIETLFSDKTNNLPYTIIDESLASSAHPGVLNTNFHEGSMKELWDYYINTRNDVLNNLGIITKSNNDKKERMTTGEVMGDVDLISRELEYQLQERKEFCERMNEAFGLDMSVELKESPVEIMQKELDKAAFQGGENNDKDSETTD